VLAALTIRDIVLIEQAALEFAPGLNVLTGETGAGKSILLDSLGLAVGGRGRASVRDGRESGLRHRRVRAAKDSRRLGAMLRDQAMERAEGDRAAPDPGRDGRSRAFINDQAVGVGC
jgi:DNA repair protein RecN (Recombination protein N)